MTAAPHDFESRRLWSLLEMLKLHMKPFVDMQDILVQMSGLLHGNDKRLIPKIPEKNRKELIVQIDRLLPELAAPLFGMCRKAAERLRESLDKNRDSKAIVIDIDDLRRRLLDQMEATFCLLLSEPERVLYEATTFPFGSEVEKSFPSAIEDIYEASKCLALERATACVMHLMRACEVALKALANAIGVPGQGDWGGYIREIDVKLTQRAKSSGKRSADEQFYSEAAASFDHLKRAWRNPSMHVDRVYTPERAREIMDAVKSFMAHLSSKISEKP